VRLKFNNKSMLNKKVGLIALLVSISASDLFAGTLSSYSIGDILLCFRKPSSGNDLVVDAGPVSTLVNGTNNQRFAISQFTGSQLALIGTNSTTWSALTYYDNTVSPTTAQWDLFISKGRASAYRQSAPWFAEGSAAQQLPAGDISTIVPGATGNLGYNAVNTASAIVEPDDTTGNSPYYLRGNCYDFVVGPNSDISGDWEGNIELTTPSTFTTSGKVVRSDFYQMSPPDTGTGLTTFLGYFEFNTNGAMTFVAKPTLPTVTTLAASGVTATNSHLNATINPIGDGTTMFFQYGLSTAYGSTSVTNIIGTTPGTYGLSVSNLVAGTQYHFRAAAFNRVGTNYGSDLTFTTTGGSSLVTPVITQFVRSNHISYVTFTTGTSGTYTLRGTNTLGVRGPFTNWPAITSTPGNGSVNTLQDTTAISNKFYLITAQ
jgi:hypothetical protein